MTSAYVGTILQQLLTLVALVAAPPLLAGLTVGLVMGILQAATQIQEQSLTFIPKVAAIGFALVVSGPWALDKLIGFFHLILDQIARGNAGALQ